MREGTNGIPKELEDKLGEAKDWYDTIDLDAMSDSEFEAARHKGADLLAEIVEVIDETWGWGLRLKKTGG